MPRGRVTPGGVLASSPRGTGLLVAPELNARRAGARTTRPGLGGATFVSFPLFGPWGGWYPWYGSAFGWNLGFVTYDPWSYGATDWIWGRYGMGYDPYAYAPYDDFDLYSADLGAVAAMPPPSPIQGSIRIRANPTTAKVYVDGALAGTVDDFNGLSHHLSLDVGRHELQLRADGYAAYTTDVNVELGRTITVRANLKKS